jgi:hypothetical protein
MKKRKENKTFSKNFATKGTKIPAKNSKPVSKSTKYLLIPVADTKAA